MPDTTITIEVEQFTAQYAGCGTHKTELTITVADHDRADLRKALLAAAAALDNKEPF